MLHALLPAAFLAAAAPAETGPAVGAAAPEFRLTTVDGREVTLASLRGKTVVLNDWATWCPPCREETADLVAVAKRLAPARDVVFLGVDSTERAPLVRAFVAAKGVPYAQAVDGDKAFAKAYDVRAFPTTFVIGPDGVLRARYVGTISVPVLTGFVADARANRNGVLATEAQKKADGLLDPSRFAFGGDLESRRKAARAVLTAVDDAEAIDGDTDFARIQAEENALRTAAADALAPLATAAADRVLVARLRGDTFAAREQWPQALAAYRDGLAAAPDESALLAGLAAAQHASGDDEAASRTYEQLAERDPSVDNLVSLGISEGNAKRFADASVTFSRAIGTAHAAVTAAPNDAKAIRKLAWAYLYDGRTAVKAGETARARAAFAQAALWAGRLPKTDSRYAMYLEQAQEETVALDGARADGKTALSLAPWTGPDLPGSVASTYKYRLVVAGAPGKTVALTTSGLPKRWIASFCTDRVCAPFRTTVALPPSGVKVIEFQVIPQTTASTPVPAIRVDGDGASASVTP